MNNIKKSKLSLFNIASIICVLIWRLLIIIIAPFAIIGLLFMYLAESKNDRDINSFYDIYKIIKNDIVDIFYLK